MSAFVFVLLLTPAADGPPDRLEGDLRAELWEISREVDLGGAAVIRALFAASQEVTEEAEDPGLHLFRAYPFIGPRRPPSWALRRLAAGRDDLSGLRLRPDREAELRGDAKDALRRLTLTHREILTPRSGGSPYEQSLEADNVLVPLIDLLAGGRSWAVKDLQAAAGRLEQFAQVYPTRAREHAVHALRGGGADARQALARRAAFDLSPAVRLAARRALAGREASDVRPTFLAALRHPWPPVADHAARALFALEDVGALPALRGLVDRPAPGEPYRQGERWLRRDVVRIDHLRNCLLCHPAASDAPDKEAVLGRVQVPDTPLQPEGGTGNQVYAHVVLLRQEFSVVYDRERAGRDWPRARRFDFVTHARPLTDDERRDHLVRRAGPPEAYPQREAVRWAIRALEGVR